MNGSEKKVEEVEPIRSLMGKSLKREELHILPYMGLFLML